MNSHVEIGSSQKQNALIEKKVNEALELELAKLNSDCGDRNGVLKDVIELLSFALRGNLGIVAPLLTTFLGSMVNSLIEGLSARLSDNGLVGGLFGAVGGVLHGLTTNTLSGFSDYLKTIFT